jgi:diacylglycerol kinase (ATP)
VDILHHLFIVNPTAGKGNAVKMIEKIDLRFKNFSQPYSIKVTEAPGHARSIAHDALSIYDNLRIYSVGGDGTLNEIVNGMAGSHAELGIIPCGSGNDAVRSIYSITDPLKLIEILPVASSVKVDLGRINQRYFINIASIGFDAEVALKSQSLKRIPFISGPMSYILGVLTSLIYLKKYRLRLKFGESERIEKNFLLTAFANGSYYGGGMKPAPKAKINDGLLDFYMVDFLPRRRILRFFPLYKKGLHESMKEVSMKRGQRAIIESHCPFPLNIDGEVSTETRIVIDILPGFINVLCP